MPSCRGGLRGNSGIGDFARRNAVMTARFNSGTPQTIEQSKRLLRHGVPPPGDMGVRPYNQQAFRSACCRPVSIDIEDRERNARLRSRVGQGRNVD